MGPLKVETLRRRNRMCICVYVQVSTVAYVGQQRASDPLELVVTGGCDPPDVGTRN